MKLPAFLRHSVSAKSTALAMTATLTALLLTAVALIYYEMRDYRQTHLADVRTQAEILGRASAAALAFNDRTEAMRTLSVLRARPDIEQGALYGPDGALFASFARNGTPAVPARASEPGSRLGARQLRLFHTVREGGEVLGTVYLVSTHGLRERLIAYVLILAAVMAAASGAALVLSAWLQRTVTGPILRIARAANAVVEQNDFSVRVGKTSADEDEIGALATAFDRMLEEIDRRTTALSESEQRFRNIADSAPVLIWMNDESGAVFVNRAYLDFVGVDKQVDVAGYDWAQYLHPEDRDTYVASWLARANEGQVFDQEFRFRRHDGQYRWMRSVAVPRVTAEGERLGYTGCTVDVHDARMLADALRLADRRKDEFLATLAHELRNPLAPVRNALHLMHAAPDRPGVVEEARAMIERNINQMVRLVDDLLDVSRITTGKVVLRRERVDLRSVAASAVEAATPLVRERGHRLDVDLPPPGTSINADATRLLQVFLNLLNNAAKFTPPGGHIAFAVSVRDDGIVATVRDDGIGIAPEMHAAIFEMFVQADRSLERTTSGLGVGLSLSRRLVELHGGTLHAQSAGLGKGAEFTVHIPGIVVAAAASPAASDAVAESGAAVQRILVVDDNHDFVDSMALLLGGFGHDVRAAYDGRAALGVAAEFAPHFAFLDIGLPGLNGYALARRLREAEATAGAVLVAISGWGQTDDRRRALEAGFDDFLVKPADPERIFEMLRKWQPR